MVMYTCEKCKKEFTHKAGYDRHINKKKPCSAQIGSHKSDEHICTICKKVFSSYHTLYKHMKNKVCKRLADTKEIINQIHNKQVNNSNKTVNAVKNVNNVGVDGDVKVVKFGTENLSYISDDVYKQILGRGIRSVEEFINHSNFHPDHPENHNIYIANIRDEYLVLYDGLKWSVTSRDELMEDIIYSRSDYLWGKFTELSADMDPRDVEKFKKFMSKRYDDNVLRKMKEDLTLQFYNNRYLPVRQRKTMELLENQAIRDSVNNVVSINKKTYAQVCELLSGESGEKFDALKRLLNIQ